MSIQFVVTMLRVFFIAALLFYVDGAKVSNRIDKQVPKIPNKNETRPVPKGVILTNVTRMGYNLTAANESTTEDGDIFLFPEEPSLILETSNVTLDDDLFNKNVFQAPQKECPKGMKITNAGECKKVA